ncbi:MAG: hypothetical protein K6E51_10570 [Treponema sp.]|nr:hypothetical protein [Treponema sp.]
MEELRSTEILDKEIQADARKKAERILATTEQDCKNVIAGVAARIEKTKNEKSAQYEQKIKQFAHDTDAALPLEKKRYLVSFTEKAVSQAMDSYLKNLSEVKRFDLLKGLYKRYGTVLSDKKVHAEVYGLNVKTAESYLKKELGDRLLSCKETTFERTFQESSEGISIHEGIIIESDDRSVRCRLTTDELIAELKDTYSRELVDTLFGGRLLND